MNKIKLFAGALTFMTTMAPPIHAYAATASHAELNAAEKNIDLDKSVNLQKEAFPMTLLNIIRPAIATWSGLASIILLLSS